MFLPRLFKQIIVSLQEHPKAQRPIHLRRTKTKTVGCGNSDSTVDDINPALLISRNIPELRIILIAWGP